VQNKNSRIKFSHKRKGGGWFRCVREREKGGVMIGFCWKRGRRELVILSGKRKEEEVRFLGISL